MNSYTVIAKWNEDVKGMAGTVVRFTYLCPLEMVAQGTAILKDRDLKLVEFRTVVDGKMWREME